MTGRPGDDETGTMSGMDLYRFYDADDRLLYIGISLHAAQRASTHRRKKPWWPLVARMEVEHLGDDLERAEVERLERLAIIDEEPLYNVVHSPSLSKQIKQPGPDNPLACAACGRRVTNGVVVLHGFDAVRQTPLCNLRRCSGVEHPPSLQEMVAKTAPDPCLAAWRPCYTAIWQEAMAYFARIVDQREKWHAEHITARCSTSSTPGEFRFDASDARRIFLGVELAERFPLAPFRAMEADEDLPSDPSATHLLPWPPFVEAEQR